MSSTLSFIEKQKTVTLVITEKCDLSCIYCYEHEKTARQMSFETAKSIIDAEIKISSKYDLMFDFFGGEPFLNFNLIKEIVDYVCEKYGNNYHFFATTNGTQIHGEIKEWLTKNKDIFTVGLSFDGNKEAQNINRSNSFNKIDLDFFANTYPEQPVKMTVSELSLPYFSDSVIFLHEKGFKVACNLAFMVDWMNPQNSTILQQQLEFLIDYYVKNPDIPRCTMLDFNIALLAHPTTKSDYVYKYCGCGTNMRVYSIDKKCYPCQLFAPVSAGDKAIESCDFNVGRKIPKENYSSDCNECYYSRICPMCLGSNYLSTGNMYKIDKGRCELSKVIFRANAKLKALEWQEGILQTEDEQGLLRSIIDILDN